MLVSFAAAVEGGVSFGAEISRERTSASTTEVGGSAKFGLTALFGRFFDASVQADLSQERSNREHSRETESRGHTEASVAILLYDRLTRDGGYIVQPRQLDDLRNLAPGALVELAGTIEKNAVDAVIDYIDAADILSSLALQTQPRPPAGGKHKGGAGSGPPSPLRTFRDTLDKDRKRTPISNVLLRCSEPTGCTAVVTLRTANLRDLTLSELHKNSVRVLGKVTRVIPKGATMSAFENYGMALLKPEALEAAFAQISANNETRAEFSEVEVPGPAVQVLTLMVFV